MVVLDSNGKPHAEVPVQQKAGRWTTLGSTDDAGEVTFEVFPGTKRTYRVTIGGTTAARSHKFTADKDNVTFQTMLATIRVLTTDGTPVVDVPVEQKTKVWAPIGSTNEAGEVGFEDFAGKGRRYRAEVGEVVKEKGKKLTESNPSLQLRFRPPVEDAEEPREEGDA